MKYLFIFLLIFISLFTQIINAADPIPISYNVIKVFSNSSYINETFPRGIIRNIAANNNPITIIFKFDSDNLILDNLFSGTEIEEIYFDEFDTKEVVSMENIFNNCNNLETFNLTNKNFPKLKSINGMFKNCPSLKLINFENINFTVLISMNDLFNKFDYLTVNFINVKFPKLETIKDLIINIDSQNKYFNITFQNIDFDKITIMDNMFMNIPNLVNAYFIDINAPNLYSMKEMFTNCTSLSKAIFINFFAPNISEIERMFYNSGIKQVKLDGIL